MLKKIQNMVNCYGFGLSTKDIASEIYWQLEAQGFDPCIVNERYIEIDGVTYQFRKARTKGHWTVVSF